MPLIQGVLDGNLTATPANSGGLRIGYGDLITAFLALLALAALRARLPGAIALVWLSAAIVQPPRDQRHPSLNDLSPER